MLEAYPNLYDEKITEIEDYILSKGTWKKFFAKKATEEERCFTCNEVWPNHHPSCGKCSWCSGSNWCSDYFPFCSEKCKKEFYMKEDEYKEYMKEIGNKKRKEMVEEAKKEGIPEHIPIDWPNFGSNVSTRPKGFPQPNWNQPDYDLLKSTIETMQDLPTIKLLYFAKDPENFEKRKSELYMEAARRVLHTRGIDYK